MKVLLFVPLHPLRMIYPDTLAAINALDTSGFDVDVHFEDEARTTGIVDAYDAILAKFQHGRRLALDGGYDAMLTVEYDNIIPADALQKLAAVDADVAYGLYCARNNGRWLAFLKLWSATGITYSRDEPTAQAAWGNVIDTQGVGFGCTLIRRHVLETIPFRREVGHPCANDWHFALDLMAAGYRQRHDTTVIVGHIRRDVPQETLWPIPQSPFYRVETKEPRMSDGLTEYICNDIICDAAQNHYYQVGESIWLDADKAAVLLAKGSIMTKPEPIVIEPQLARRKSQKSDDIEQKEEV